MNLQPTCGQLGGDTKDNVLSDSIKITSKIGQTQSMVFQVESRGNPQVPGVVGSDCGGHEGLWGPVEATIILS